MAFLPVVPLPIESTAFSERRVASPFTQSDHVQTYGLNTAIFDAQTAGGGTVTDVLTESAVRLAVGAAAGDISRKATREWFRYQAGKGTRWRMTLYHSDAGQAGQRRRWGQLDPSGVDGLFWQLDGTSLSIVRNTSVPGQPDEVVPQASWNEDPLDGSGKSGVTLDVTKGNIYECTYQWLGVGHVQFYINSILVHEMENQNTFSAPYMRTATLPLFWEVENTGASAAGSMTEICSTVIVEGGDEPPRFPFSHFRSAVTITSSVSPIHIFSLRCAATFNTVDNRSQLLPVALSFSSVANESIVSVRFNGTLTAPAWASAGTGSAAEIDQAGTSPTGGRVIWSQLVANNNSLVVPLTEIFGREKSRITRASLAGASDDLITVESLKTAGANPVVSASLNWNELR